MEKENKKEKILNTAIKLFADNGYKGTSISMIANEVGCTKSLIYNYYKNKEELLGGVLRKGIDIKEKYYFPILDKEFEFKEFINEIINCFIKDITENILFWRIQLPIIIKNNNLDVVKNIMNVEAKDLKIRFSRSIEEAFKKEYKEDYEMETQEFMLILNAIGIGYVISGEKEELNKSIKIIKNKYKI